MKILVVGGGSIGRRHASNLRSLSIETALFDIDAAKTLSFAEDNNTRKFLSLEEALLWNPDGVVVATPHIHHLSVARQAIDAGADVLIEKPISHNLNGVADLLAFGKSKNRNIYVVCNMRFHPAIRILRENISALGDVRYVYAYFGEWLETMRPNIDYRTVYSAHKDMGGGLILDCIHEIDYLGWFFGSVSSLSCSTDKLSALEIDVEDYASLHLKYDCGVHAEIHMDYLQRLKRRGCEIIGERGSLLWTNEGKNPEICTVRHYDAEKDATEILLQSDNLDVNQMYVDMIASFVDLLKDKDKVHNLSTGQKAFETLTVCMAAYNSTATGTTIRLSDFNETRK